VNKRFADFPRDFADLPTVSLVIPNQNNDMHDGSYEQADQWLQRRIGPFVDCPVELPRGHRIGRIQAGEEPPAWQDLALGPSAVYARA
jgi:hypothetical protein